MGTKLGTVLRVRRGLLFRGCRHIRHVHPLWALRARAYVLNRLSCLLVSVWADALPRAVHSSGETLLQKVLEQACSRRFPLDGESSAAAW